MATIVGGWWKIKINTGQNNLKQSPKKQNLVQNISDSKSHIWILFLKMWFWSCKFFIFIRTFQWPWWQKVSNPTKTSEKNPSFYNTVSTQLKIFLNFPANMSLFVVRKNICTWRPRTRFLKHFKSKCLYIFVNLCKNVSVPET